MATNVQIDDKLLNEALKVGGQKTKKATVTEALQECGQHRQQMKLIELFGTIDYDPSYDSKKHRKRR